jgi:hypothetical protein
LADTKTPRQVADAVLLPFLHATCVPIRELLSGCEVVMRH